MNKKANQNEMSKAWRIVPCAIFVAFFNVFLLGSLESQAQLVPTYTSVLNTITYSGNQATLKYTVHNTSFNTVPTGMNGIRWNDVMSTQPPSFVSAQNLAGFIYSTVQTGSIPGTNIKLYDVNLIPVIDIAINGGFSTVIEFKVVTPTGVSGERDDRPMECRFRGGPFQPGQPDVFPANSWWPITTEGLVFPTNPPPPPPPSPIVINRMYVSGINLAFDLQDLTPGTFNTIESSASLSNPNWVTEDSFSVSSTNQTVTIPLFDIEPGHSFFRIRTEDS